jgi:hypothetical protein
MKKQFLISLILIGSTLTMNAQWDLSSNYALYRQSDSNQIILKSSRTDNTLEGTLSTDGWGNFAFNRNLRIGGYISNIGNESKIIYRTIRTDNTQEGTLSTDGWGNFTFNRNLSIDRNLSIGGYISNIGNESKIIYRTIRTDNTCEGTLSTNGWGSYAFNRNLSIGGYISNIGDASKIIYRTIRTDNTQEGTLSTDGWGNFTFNKKVSIGTNNITEYQLNVCGTVRANEVKVDLTGCDFVFENDYQLLSLSELDNFIKKHKHLPEIASAKEMEKNGTDLGVLTSKLLQKIEELTLYTIEQNKKIIELEKQNKAIEVLAQIVKLQNEKIGAPLK